MDHSTSTFEATKKQLITTQEHVTEGTMMSSPGIQYKGKNFAFLYKNGTMCFRLGRTFDPESEGIHQYELLNPFRNKPPLKDWFVIGPDYTEQWPLLAEIALQQMAK